MILSAVIARVVAFDVWLVGAPQDQTRAVLAQPYTDAGSAVVVIGSEYDGGERVATPLDREC